MKRILIFASGSGSNAENIIKYFETTNSAKVIAVLSNKRKAGVHKRAENLGVRSLFFDKTSFYDTNEVLHIMKDAQPDLIVLAGFLWKFPDKMVQAFPNKVVNIHPALLPKYGGKGMYGMHVHEAVIANNEKESGITIHYVNEKYDEGAIIFQAKTGISPNDSVADLAQKIHLLEHEHFPKVLEGLLLQT